MEYRQNPITREWIATRAHNSLAESDLYERRPGISDTTQDATFLNDHDACLVSASPEELADFFRGYKTWIDNMLGRAPHSAIHSIIKPSCKKNADQRTSQMFLVPDSDDYIDKTIINARKYYLKNNSCLWCGMIDQEIKSHDRMVCQTDDFVVFVSYFARLPYETFVLPKQHMPDFRSFPDHLFPQLGELCHDVIGRIYRAAHRSNMSLHLHNIVVPERHSLYTHWSIQLIPWMNNWAGFEIATAMYINVASPEACAARLRTEKTAK
ncbi:MAG: hypothetical protein AB1454_11360 [Candidatus Auribacterota bacterium]